MALGCAILGGCSASSNDALTVGSTEVKSPTVTAFQQPLSTETLSDQIAIIKAVVAAGLSSNGFRTAWANEETGNSGTITAIEEAVKEGRRCYRFLTTLESFTGISLYDAETCEMTAGQWVMSFFKSKQAV